MTELSSSVTSTISLWLMRWCKLVFHADRSYWPTQVSLEKKPLRGTGYLEQAPSTLVIPVATRCSPPLSAIGRCSRRRHGPRDERVRAPLPPAPAQGARRVAG